MTIYNWLTENPSNSLTHQVGDEGAEEGANEHVLQEGHVLVLAGGVQLKAGNCREQIRDEIHLWNVFVIASHSLRGLSNNLLIELFKTIDVAWCCELCAVV